MTQTKKKKREIVFKSVKEWMDYYRLASTEQDKELEDAKKDPKILGALLANRAIDKILENQGTAKS